MKANKNYKFWFCAGSQDLYGDAVLANVATHTKEMVDKLNASGNLPYEIVWKPTLLTNELIRKTFNEANIDDECAGVIVWCHTFSPAKSWILGLKELRKPLLHFLTQYNEEIPYDTMDMDFMNENQSAHGDREYGHIVSRMGIERKIVAPLKEVLQIFDSIYENLPKKLFLARWYPESGVEKRKADARFKALQNVAKAENLELIDMEHMRRGSFSIRDAIDQAIPNSDLFVADMTGLRPNVMVEIGMALHHLPKNRVLFYMQKADDVPGSIGPVEDPPFDLCGYSYVKIVDSAEINTMVRLRLRGILNEMRAGNVVEGCANSDENDIDLEMHVDVPVETECASTAEEEASVQGDELKSPSEDKVPK